MDPITLEIRYVGKTVGTLIRRLNQHMCAQNRARNNHTCNWLNKLKQEKQRPIISLLDSVDNEVWEDMEKYWIEQLTQWGFKLTNTTPGGGCGSLGYTHTESAKSRIGKLNSRPKSEEWKKNAADAMRNSVAVPIVQYDKFTNEVIKRWESVCYISKALNDPTGSKKKNITACCKGKRPSAYGYVWKYENIELSDKEQIG